MVTVIAGLAAAAALWLFYGAVQNRWPEQYSAISTVLDSYIREHLWMYLAFRLVPVYLVGVFIAVIVERAKGSIPLALTIMTVAHLTLTNGRSIVLLLRSRSSKRMQTLLIYNAVVVVVVVLTTAAAGLTFRLWDGLVPNPSDLVVAAWAGVFAVILAVSAQRLVRFRGENGEELLAHAKRDIGSSPWQYAEEAAERQATDPLLIQAILAAEALQRPHWIRRLERTKGRILPRGTYGVAQVASDQPLSDQESIDRLCSSWAGYFPERDSYGSVADVRLAARLEQHNSNPGFAHSAIDFYRQLQPQPFAQSERTARDHRPVIEVNRISRQGQTWELSGTASVYEANLIVTTSTEDGTSSTSHTTATTGAPGRGRWSIELPLAVRKLWLSTEQMEEDSSEVREQLTVFVDLTNPYVSA
jgi:hypothetical protein